MVVCLTESSFFTLSVSQVIYHEDEIHFRIYSVFETDHVKCFSNLSRYVSDLYRLFFSKHDLSKTDFAAIRTSCPDPFTLACIMGNKPQFIFYYCRQLKEFTRIQL